MKKINSDGCSECHQKKVAKKQMYSDVLLKLVGKYFFYVLKSALFSNIGFLYVSRLGLTL